MAATVHFRDGGGGGGDGVLFVHGGTLGETGPTRRTSAFEHVPSELNDLTVKLSRTNPTNCCCAAGVL